MLTIQQMQVASTLEEQTVRKLWIDSLFVFRVANGYNNLPSDIKNCVSVNIVKSKLLAYLKKSWFWVFINYFSIDLFSIIEVFSIITEFVVIYRYVLHVYFLLYNMHNEQYLQYFKSNRFSLKL